MSEGSGDDRRRNNRRNDRDNRDNRGRGRGGRGDRGGRFRDDRESGRLRDDRDSGRLNADTDSYRPGSGRYAFFSSYIDQANNQGPALANLASAVYEVAAPHPPTKKAMVASDSQKTTPTYAPAIAAEAEVATPDADENRAASAGHTTSSAQQEGDGNRMR
jgi:hypothetical protein